MDMFEQEIIGMLKEVKSELQVIKGMLTPTPEPQPSTTIGGESKSKSRSRKPKETAVDAQVAGEVESETPIVDVKSEPTPIPIPLRILRTWASMGMSIPFETALEKNHIKAINQHNSEAGVLAFIYGLNKDSPDMDELSKALTAFFSTKYRTLALSLFEARQNGTFTLEEAVVEWERETGKELAT